MNGNARRKAGRPAKAATNRATILSVDAEAAPNSFRVSLQWRGTHDISDFDLQRLGKVLRIQDETENTGWVTIERPFRATIAHTYPGWAINESMCKIIPGDTIPLRKDLQ
jgi:hypothetical protein